MVVQVVGYGVFMDTETQGIVCKPINSKDFLIYSTKEFFNGQFKYVEPSTLSFN